MEELYYGSGVGYTRDISPLPLGGSGQGVRGMEHIIITVCVPVLQRTLNQIDLQEQNI